jgi:hypothetical protein
MREIRGAEESELGAKFSVGGDTEGPGVLARPRNVGNQFIFRWAFKMSEFWISWFPLPRSRAILKCSVAPL